MNAKLYYDTDVYGHDVPLWLVVDVTGMDWDVPTLYLDVTGPLQKHPRDEFYPDVIAMSVLQTEIVRDSNCTNQIGINILSLKHRLEDYEVQPENVEKLIIQAIDIDDVLSVDLGGLKL